MKSFTIRRIETETKVYELEVFADDKEQAQIKASVGPIGFVLEKEGVVLTSVSGFDNCEIIVEKPN